MDVKIKNSWVNDEIIEEEEIENEEEIKENNIIDKKTFNNLMDVPNNPIEEFNFKEFMKKIDEPKKEIPKIKKERKRLFEFRENKINYYYIIPIIGVATFMMLMK